MSVDESAPPPAPYVQFGGATATRWTFPWAVAALTMYWGAAITDLVVSVLVQRRSNAWQHAYGVRSPDAYEAAAVADDRVAAIALISWPITILALCLLGAWSFMVAGNARARGVPGIRAARVGGLWAIPLFGPPLSIKHVARYVKAFDYSDHRLTQWRHLMYLNFVMIAFMELVIRAGFKQQHDEASSADALSREAAIRYVMSAIFALTAVLATRAVLHADRAIASTEPIPADAVPPSSWPASG